MDALLFFFLLVAATIAVAVPAAAEPDAVTCVKEKLDCETTDDIVWVVRCIGDSLNGHHCTQP